MSNGFVRGTLQWLRSMSADGEHGRESAASILRHMIADCEKMYPWPALVESWRQDMEYLEAPSEAQANPG